MGLTAANYLFFSNMYTYMNEILGGRLRLLFPSFSFALYSLGGVFVSLASIWLTGYRAQLYLSLCSTLAASAFFFYFLESPFYLYKAKDIRKLYSGLLRICERNFPKEELPRVKARLQKELRYGAFFQSGAGQSCDLQTEGQSLLPPEGDGGALPRPGESPEPPERKPEAPRRLSGRLGCLKLFSRANLGVFVKFMGIFVMIETVFGMSMIINKDLGIPSVYLSGVLVALFQGGGYLCSSFFILRFGRRTLNLFCSAVAGGLSLALLALDLISKHFFAYSERPLAVQVAETGALTSHRPGHHFPELRPVFLHLHLRRRNLQNRRAQLRHCAGANAG